MKNSPKKEIVFEDITNKKRGIFLYENQAPKTMSQKLAPHPKKDVLASEPSIMETQDSVCIIKPVVTQNVDTFGSIASEFNYKA